MASSAGLASVFLAHLAPAEQPAAVATVVKDLFSRSLKGPPDVPTAFLAAELLQRCPEGLAKDTATNSLLLLMVHYINRTDPDAVSLADLIRLCAQYDFLSRHVLLKLGSVLAKTAADLRDEDRLAVPTSDIPWKYHPRTPEAPMHVRHVDQMVRYLAFLKFFFWSEPRCSISVNLVQALLVLLGADSDKLSHGSRDALSAAFHSIQTGKAVLDMAYEGGFEAFDEFETPVGELIWSRIKDLLSAAPDSGFSAIAFHIWFRWFALGGHLGPSRSILAQDGYWHSLQQGLGDGFSEQRKFCLHILRASVHFSRAEQEDLHPYVAGSKSASYEVDYARYCTLFETIILGRYLNQVEECMPDLQSLAWKSEVHPTWIITLLRASLRLGIQDSIRKLIGNRILQNVIPMPTIVTESFQEFLASSFLPWATQGFLYTGTIRRSGQQVRCEHGENLTSFIRTLLQNCFEDSSRRAYSRVILSYLKDKGQRLFQYALPYCLQGILDGFERPEASRTKLAVQDIPLLIQVATLSGLPEVARDFSTAAASILVEEAVNDEPEVLATIPGYIVLQERWADLRREQSPEEEISKSFQSFFNSTGSTSDAAPSLKSLVRTLHDTKYQCLKGAGLLQACDYVRHVLIVNDELDPGSLHTSLEAIWDEMDTQEYPRPVLMLLPEIFFHPTCLRAASDDTRALLSRALTEFQAFTEGRIYVLSPLAKALRRAYLQVPEVVGFLPLEDFIVRFANNPPVPKLEFLLEAAVAGKLAVIVPRRTYTSYYGPGESLGYAYIFELLNRLRDCDRPFAKRILDRLIRPWTMQKMPIPMVSKWKATTQVQVMLLLAQTSFAESSTEEIGQYLAHFMGALSIEPLPRYRFLLEWIIARIYVREPDQRNYLLTLLDTGDHSNPKHLASVMKMAVMVARLPDADEAFAHQLMTLLVPLSSSPKIVVRHEAQWSFPPLWDHAEQRGWTALTDNPAFAALNKHIRALEKYISPPPGRTLEWLDPITNNTLATLFGGRYLDMDPAEARVVSTDDFKAIWAADSQSNSYPLPHIPLGLSNPPTAPPTQPHPPSSSTTPTASAPAPTPDALTIPLQTKDGAPLSPAASSPSTTRASSTPVLLVASLIDNPHNLGGLSRCAEIFGCAALYARSLDVLAHRDFVAVAVSSQHHLPIHPLPPATLPAFLRARRADGYVVVGVEQTDRSIILGADGAAGALPRRAVVVMGGEREGIPAAVLAECDLCVEVRQVGVTRSLNVQTAAAVVLFEYQRQYFGR